MAITLNPPPLNIPPDFASDKYKGTFFSALISVIYQIWTALYKLQFQAEVKTTDATITGLVQIPVDTDKTIMITANIVARRTGGSAGANGDSAWYEIVGGVKNINGVTSIIGTTLLRNGEDQASWNVGIQVTGAIAVVVVQGAANNDIVWEGTLSTYEAGA